MHGQAVQALRQLLAAPGEQTHLPLLDYGRQLLQLEPLDESACSQFLQLLARQGQRDEALWYYQRYQAVLSDVWATATPSEALVMLAAKIRLGLGYAVNSPPMLGHTAQRQPIAVRPQLPAVEAPQIMKEKVKEGAGASTAVFHFPAPLKPLLGRRQEWEQLVQWLDLGYRLISITGLGGGPEKSFRADTDCGATDTLAEWRFYVALPAPIITRSTQTQLTPHERQQMAVTALVRALYRCSLRHHSSAYPGLCEQLQAALSGYACCLVLDNFEQVLPAAAYLQSLLARLLVM